MKYKQNLRVDDSKVFSYDTHVATIDCAAHKLLIHGYWSVTTSKHVNHVADVYGLTKVKAEKAEAPKEEKNPFKIAAGVAMLGNIFCDSQAEKNAWKKRMLVAGVPGLDIPNNWDGLSEAEKEKRLDGVIELAKGGI
uniref:DUF8033 domain-containing protein n=1 Tax=viral metagenome TaxID=1070528 RepID=A0A6H1ZZ22_9ZZZZ